MLAGHVYPQMPVIKVHSIAYKPSRLMVVCHQ